MSTTLLFNLVLRLCLIDFCQGCQEGGALPPIQSHPVLRCKPMPTLAPKEPEVPEVGPFPILEEAEVDPRSPFLRPSDLLRPEGQLTTLPKIIFSLLHQPCCPLPR